MRADRVTAGRPGQAQSGNWALTDAAAQHPHSVKRLLVPDRDALADVESPGLKVQPAYERLLETSARALVGD